MSIDRLLILIVIAAFIGLLRGRARALALFFVSITAVYWLQPSLPVRGLGFWLSTAALALVVAGWLSTSKPDWKRSAPALALLVFIPLLLDAGRYLPPEFSLFPGILPRFDLVLLVLSALAAGFFLLARFRLPGRVLLPALTVLLLFLFIALKSPNISLPLSRAIRVWFGSAPETASASDLSWLGFSYLAFRILHTLRDTATGRFTDTTLDEYVTYAVFFPAYSAGPIDRLERFINDLREPLPQDLFYAGQRLVTGLFKKFVLADSLRLLALNPQNALQLTSTSGTWLALYAFAFQIYFDFSGYTDIAIGLARLMGIQLPENFRAPYLQPNLTQFWNNWHITLTQWFRAYVFNPLARAMRIAKNPPPETAAIFVSQVSTMLLIGLWHGITWNFLLWGAWHGIGLFLHNRWSSFIRPRMGQPKEVASNLLNILGILITFNYVALGWVFFILPAPADAVHILRSLFRQ